MIKPSTPESTMVHSSLLLNISMLSTEWIMLASQSWPLFTKQKVSFQRKGNMLLNGVIYFYNLVPGSGHFDYVTSPFLVSNTEGERIICLGD